MWKTSGNPHGKLFLIRVISIYRVVCSTEYPLLSPPGIEEMRQNMWWKGRILLFRWCCSHFCQNWCLQLRKPQANLSASESAACCVRVQLGRRRTKCLVTYEIFYKGWMFSSRKAACRDDGAASANTAALRLLTSQRRPPTLPAA